MASALDSRTSELVGVAEAVAGHCQPCFDHRYRQALEAGATRAEIRAAVALARAVRPAGEGHMDEPVARGMTEEVIPPATGATRSTSQRTAARRIVASGRDRSSAVEVRT